VKKSRKGRIFATWFNICQILFPATNIRAEDERAYLSTRFVTGSVGIKSWKTLRDECVVKQDLDTSCGAAAIATLLNEYYGQSVSVLVSKHAGGFSNPWLSIRCVAIHYEQLEHF